MLYSRKGSLINSAGNSATNTTSTSGLVYSASSSQNAKKVTYCKAFKIVGIFCLVLWIYLFVTSADCPEVLHVDEFQIEYFLGRWYQ